MDTALAPGFPLYHRIAAGLERAIAEGSLRTGDRLPSVRQLCQQHAISASTATLAYRWLENRALVEAWPKSGYFVAARQAPLPEPELDTRMSGAGFVTPDDVMREFLLGADDPLAAPSFRCVPARSLLPEAKLRHLAARINRLHPEYASQYEMMGSTALRQEIARRGVNVGLWLRPDQIVITNGGTEALLIALRAAAKPGDTIALESPTYWMLLEIVRSLGMRSVEIPTHPRDGVSIEAMELATREAGAVTAAVVIPNFHNPLGCLMPIDNKRRLVALAAQRDFTLIETDIYGETHFGDERPPALKAFDTHDDVILCSAFTKTVAPGYRVGWIAPGRHFARVQSLKFHTSCARRGAAAGSDRRVHARRRLRPPHAQAARRDAQPVRTHDRRGDALLPGRMPLEPAARRLHVVDRIAAVGQFAQGVRDRSTRAHRAGAGRHLQLQRSVRSLYPHPLRRAVVDTTRDEPEAAGRDRCGTEPGNQGLTMSAALVASLVFTVALLVTHGYFLFGSVPLLTLDHGTPMDARFVRRFFKTYYLAALATACAAAISLAFASRWGLATGAAALALLAAGMLRTIIPRMEALQLRIRDDERSAIAAFRRIHVTAILLNVSQLVVIVWSLIAASMR